MKSAIFLILLLACPLVSFADSEPFEMSEGMAAFNNDDWENAVEYLNIAVKKDPTLWKAYQYLAYSYYEQHDLQNALTACNQSLSFHPDNGDFKGFRNKVVKDIQAASSKSNTIPAAPITTAMKPTYPDRTKIFYCDAGLALPNSPSNFQTVLSPGYSIGGGVGLGLSKIFSLLLDVDVNNFTLNTGAFPGYFASGGSVWDITGTINGKFRFIADDNFVVPYGIVGMGIGFYNAQPLSLSNFGFYSTSIRTAGLSTADYIFRLALGMDIKLKPGEYIFIEGDLTGTSTGLEDITYGILKMGVTFNADQITQPAH